MMNIKEVPSLRSVIHTIGQVIGFLSAIGVTLLWTYAMWGPSSILLLSNTSFSGAFIMTVIAIVAVIASIHGHGVILLLMFFLSFCPIGFFFLTESHWLSWTGVLDLGFLLAGVLLLKTKPISIADNTKDNESTV